MSKESGAQTIGFRYYLGLHMGVCRGPVNELVQIDVADKQAWPVPANSDDADPVPDTHRFYPPLMTISTPVAIDDGSGEYSVTVEVDTPYTFGVGALLEFSEWTRTVTGPDEVLDMSGQYVVLQRTEFASIGEPSYSVIPASITINIGTDAANWTRFANGTPNQIAPLVEVEIELVGSAGGGGDIMGVPVEDSGNIFINAGRLFGGDSGEGGIEGYAAVMMGEPTQLPPDGLVQMHGSPQPGFRGRLTIWFNGLIAAMNPYPKPWKFRVRRSTEGWNTAVFYEAKAKIVLSRAPEGTETSASFDIHAMNPAHIVYECLTNPVWGRGLDPSRIDTASFIAAADTLYDEGFGLCMRWDRQDEIEAFVQTVIDHCGAVMYEDQSTALMKLVLIRGNYDIDDLPVYTPSTGLLEITESKVLNRSRLVNEIKVQYTDAITGREQSVTVPNVAGVQAAGGVVNSMTKQYPGLPTAALALRVGQREMRAKGLDIRPFTFTLDRRGWNTSPGSVVVLDDVTRNVRNMPVRVLTVDFGRMGDSRVVVTGIQDVFSLPTNPFVTAQPGTQNNIPQLACVGIHKVIELPYAMVVPIVSAADLDYIEDDDCFVGVIAEPGLLTNVGYRFGVRSGQAVDADYPNDENAFCGYEWDAYRLALDIVDLETACYENPFDAQAELIDNFEALYGPAGWTVKPGYPRYVEGREYPVATRLQYVAEAAETVIHYRVISYDTGEVLGTTEPTYDGAVDAWMDTFLDRTTTAGPTVDGDVLAWTYMQGMAGPFTAYFKVETTDVTVLVETTVETQEFLWTAC